MGQIRYTDEEVRRYARQMILPEVGGIGQARLRNGSAVAANELEALYLAGAGVGTIYVADEDIADAVKALNPLVEAVVDPGQTVAVSKLHAHQDSAERALARIKELLAL